MASWRKWARMVLTSLSLRVFAVLLCLTAATVSSARDDQTNRKSAQPDVLQNTTPLESRAQAGDPEAQFLLGFRYDQKNNYTEALQWYGKAADQGYALAQSALGSMYQM